MDAFKDYTQDMDFISLTICCGPIVAVVICGIIMITKSKSSRANPPFKPHKCADNILNLGTSSHSNHLKSTNVSGKQRKSRSGNKQQAFENNNTVLRTKNNKDHKSLTGFAIKNWLQNDTYCYEKKFLTSCFKDKVISNHTTNLKENTSIANVKSENLNSFSSNEDLSVSYLEKRNQANKEVIIKQKRKQKRKQHAKPLNNQDTRPVDIDEEIKENIKPKNTKKTSSNTIINLRKQCTKAAALKSALSNSQISSTFNDSDSSLESNLSVGSSLSSFSSLASISSSISSSASSTPTKSVNSSPTASPMAFKIQTQIFKNKNKCVTPPLRQFTKLNMKEYELVQQMQRYVVDPSLLKMYGFPVESVYYKNCVEISKSSPKHVENEAKSEKNKRHLDESYGLINRTDGLHANSCSGNCIGSSADSGHGSAESSPRFSDSDSSEIGEEDGITTMTYYANGVHHHSFSEYCNSLEKQCSRCHKLFLVNEKGEYLSFDSCTYHWGKLSTVYNGYSYVDIYSCCQRKQFSEGCCKHRLHVWGGIGEGVYTGYVHTQCKNKQRNHPKIYAIDCEMSYTGLGLEVTKVSVVNYKGYLVYEHFVKPLASIIDYNTRYSGVSEKDFLPNSNNSIKTFAEVQNDLLNLFDSDTILVGHALENDLKALRLVHKRVVDTSVIFSYTTGYPYKRSLKSLTKTYLKRDIQCGDIGHNSFEDSRACLELVLWKIRNDLHR